ncbi:hypothetical protein AS189_15025 [Arthrobacter alpinus]|uniref:Transglycosylase n=1 Tax=Arthrobacter alpinus TaxID=656366 RepID=A0A0S2M217_9MICC|nr:hypothetical protein [Arthrobacter alpinus]ALO67560.1 hypothetical protein AS189_15025 [Arthrobacter alpinus]
MRTQLPPLSRFLAGTMTAGIFLVCGMSAGPALAQDAPPSGFPTWAEVQAAKGNASATAAAVSKIGQLLDSLESEAGTVGTAAVQAGATYALTERKLDAAAAEVSVLNEQVNRAADQAAKNKKDAVAVAVQSYKNGGTDFGLFATVAALDTPESLNGVELLQQVGEQAALKQAKATQSLKAADALEQTRQAAQAAQAQLTSEALSDRDAAVAAQTAVVTALDAKKEQSATLTAQLATLNNTSAAKEAQYRQGQDALAAYNEAQEAKRRAAEVARLAEAKRQAEEQAAAQEQAQQQKPALPNPAPNPANPNPANPNPAPAPVPEPVTPPAQPAPGGGFIPVEVLLPNIPGGAVNDPAGARAYASSQMAANGWAQGEFQCLNQLWDRESSWLTNATNPSSGAYGIAQSLPPGKYASAGSDWLTNYRTQINWGLGYIKNRYGSPCGAWNHSQSVGWY